MNGDYVYLDRPDPQPGRYVGGCTCAGSGVHHEPHCGWDIDDEPRPVAPPRPDRRHALRGGAPMNTDITHADLVRLTRWMAEQGTYTADDIAYAVEKPWKHDDELRRSRLTVTDGGQPR